MSDGVLQLSVALIGAASLVALALLVFRMRTGQARARRLAAARKPQPYAEQPATPRTPFPAPPPPIAGPAHPAERTRFEPRPAGLPEVRLAAPDASVVPTPGSRPPMPSGLTGARGMAASVYQPRPSGLHPHEEKRHPHEETRHPHEETPARHRHRAEEQPPVPATPAGGWPGLREPAAWAGQSHAEPRVEEVYPRHGEPVSRLRQPAYLADRPVDRGRHRAADPGEA